MFCYKCGTAMADQATVCPQCGTPVQGAAAPQPTPGVPPAAAPTPAAGTGTARPVAGAGWVPPAPGASAQQPPRPAPAQQPVNPWLKVPPMATATPAAYTGPQETDGKAVGSLILGILAIVPLGLLAGIPAIILGHLSRKSIRESMGRLKGEGMALAGLIMGYISVAAIPLVLIIAAIAIPGLLRAKIAANESAAMTTVRTVNTSQAVYSTTYPKSGYAMSLAVMGPGAPPRSCGSGEPDVYHACLLDDILACSSSGWCEKGGYRYHVNAVCSGDLCSDYVVTATPITSATGSRSFCSTSDSVVRMHYGPLFEPVSTPEECQAWSPV